MPATKRGANVGPTKHTSCSLLEAADLESQAAKKRIKCRDVPQQAQRSIANKLSVEQLNKVAFMVHKGKKLQFWVEEEIKKQGPNFKLLPKFWREMFEAFKLTENPVADLSCESDEELREDLIDALEQVFSNNHCQRGTGLQMLKACLKSGSEFSKFAVKSLVDASFAIDDASKTYTDKVQFEILDYLCRNEYHRNWPELWMKVHMPYNIAASRVYQREKEGPPGTTVQSWMEEYGNIVMAYCESSDLKILFDKHASAQQVQQALQHCYTSGPLAKMLFEETQSKVTFRLYREEITVILDDVTRGIVEWTQEIYDYYEKQCKAVAKRFTSKVGSWSRVPIDITVHFLNQQLDCIYHDWQEEWKLPLAAGVRQWLLAQGLLRPMPWEAALGIGTETLEAGRDSPISQVIAGLGKLRDLPLYILVSDEMQTELNALERLVSGLKLGKKPVDPDDSSTEMYKQVFNKLPGFFSHKIEEPVGSGSVADMLRIRSKTLYGVGALRTCLEDHHARALRSLQLGAAEVRRMRPYTAWFDAECTAMWTSVITTLSEQQQSGSHLGSVPPALVDHTSAGSGTLVQVPSPQSVGKMASKLLSPEKTVSSKKAKGSSSNSNQMSDSRAKVLKFFGKKR